VGRTNIVLDDALVDEGLGLSGARTRRELVDRALRAYVQVLKVARLRRLRGTVRFDEGHDPGALRARQGDEANP